MTNYPLFTYCPTYSVLLFLRFHDALSLFLKKYDYGMIRCSYFMLFLLLLFTYILKKKFTKWLMTFLISLPAMFPNVIHSVFLVLSASCHISWHHLPLHGFLSLTICLGLAFLAFDTSQSCFLFGRLHPHTIMLSEHPLIINIRQSHCPNCED